ncbi:MAG: NAD(P)H-binding protein [Muribaculaceae bacterium]|nr:NAD(P)H-binding protein [Muribaculaceae bacterium]
MKEIALVGSVNEVQADVLGALLRDGKSVNAMVEEPMKVMIEDTRLTVTLMPVEDHKRLVEAFTGYKDAVLVYNDDLQDAASNAMTLKYFVDTVNAAREAGVERVVVVGGQYSEAFYMTYLRRMDDIKWEFCSTRGDYSAKVVDALK